MKRVKDMVDNLGGLFRVPSGTALMAQRPKARPENKLAALANTPSARALLARETTQAAKEGRSRET